MDHHPGRDYTEHCPKKPIPYMPEHPVLAMAYVPMQELGAMYPPWEALKRGTLFSDLDLPFEGETIGGGCCHD